jgi:hypothetical protein
LRGCTVSEKLPKIPLFEPTLIHQLQLLGSQQHPQSGLPLTSFPTWGIEKKSGGDKSGKYRGDKGFQHFLDQKLANTCSFVGGRIVVQQKKNLESRTQLDEPFECASGGDPLLLHTILHLLFSLWYEFFVHYALRV